MIQYYNDTKWTFTSITFLILLNFENNFKTSWVRLPGQLWKLLTKYRLEVKANEFGNYSQECIQRNRYYVSSIFEGDKI